MFTNGRVKVTIVDLWIKEGYGVGPINQDRCRAVIGREYDDEATARRVAWYAAAKGMPAGYMGPVSVVLRPRAREGASYDHMGAPFRATLWGPEEV